MSVPDVYREKQLSQPATQIAYGTRAASAAEDRLDFRHLISIFRRRLVLFAAVVGNCVMLALLVTLYLPKMYEASADVVMNQDRREIVPNQQSATSDDSPLRSEQLATEMKVVTSPEVARQVVAALKLDKDREFLDSVTYGDGLAGSIRRLIGRSGDKGGSAAAHDRKLADAIVRNLSATRIDTAYAIHITYRSSDPQRAAAVVNAIAEQYAASGAGFKRAENEKSLALLRSRIDELRDQAQTDFKAVQDYRVSNNLLSSQATQLSEINASAYAQQLAAAQAAAAQDSGKAGAAAGAGDAAAVASPVVAALRSQRAVLSVKVAELSGRYLEGYPELALARRELADIDRQISAETSRVRAGVAAGLSSDARATSQQVGTLQRNLSNSRATLADNNKALVGLDDLNRKAQTSQTLYENYLNRYKEVLAQAGTEQPEARVLSSATVPGSPASPKLMINLLLGLVVGSLLGAGAAIATESNYTGLTTGDDVERRLGVRYGGGIPLLSSVGIKADQPQASLTSTPNSAYAESLRGLLTSIRQSADGRCQVVCVTSALPGEGKTTLAASLARIAALAGETAIVIDCDLVRHNLSTMFVTDPARPGLREVMRDGTKLGDAMFKDTDTDAMILPITQAFNDGERLLERGNFHQMLGIMREHFNLIVLDTGPILASAETREIVSLADAVVMAMVWRDTPDAAVRSAIKLLPVQVMDKITAVLTRIDMKKQAKYGFGDVTFFYDKYKKYYA